MRAFVCAMRPPLPPGWAGKQHACYSGASVASHPILLFIDCDVRLAPDAVAAMCGFLTGSGAPLVSGFPRERTSTAGEALLIPLIHVLLLGYLPIFEMRRSAQPSLGAGCGQIMLADAAIYRRTGGHAMIRRSWHDGLQLPRAFRRAGYRTDIFDASGVAECRMYRGFAETWRGFSKNAREGMATAVALPIWTVLLGGGLVMPFVLAPAACQCADDATSCALAGRLVGSAACAARPGPALSAKPAVGAAAAGRRTASSAAAMARAAGRDAGPGQVWRGRTEVHWMNCLGLQPQVAAIRAAQPDWAARPIGERLAVIARLRRHLAADCEALAASVNRPNMSPADILVAEVMPSLAACRFLEKQAARLLKPRRPPGRRPLWLFGVNLLVRRMPFGVVLILGPSNYPLLLPAIQVVQALAAGNGVMVKPAPGWAAPMQMLAEALATCGPAGQPASGPAGHRRRGRRRPCRQVPTRSC